MLDGMLYGAAQVIAALRALRKSSALRKAALWPAFLNALAVAAIASLAVWDDWGVDGAGWHWAALKFAAVFTICAALPPTVLHPLWVKVAQRTRTELGLPPEPPEEVHGYARMVVHETKKAFQQAIIGGTIGLLPILMLLGILPGTNVLEPLVIMAWAIYWMLIDAFEFCIGESRMPMPPRAAWFARWAFAYGNGDYWWSFRIVRKFGHWLHRLARPWRREIAFTESHAPATVGFGLALSMVFAFPVLGLIFRPVAIIAATRLASLEPSFVGEETAPLVVQHREPSDAVRA